MNNDNKNLIKQNLKKILMYYGAVPTKNNWQCIPGRHETPNFDLSVKENQNICCCHCGLQGDSLNVIATIENLNLNNDFQKILQRGLDIIGISKPLCNHLNNREIKTKNNYMKNYMKPSLNLYLNDIITKEYEKINDYNYFYSRGITNKTLFDRFKFIVKNPSKIFPRKILPNIYNIWAYEYIIPVWENGKIVNCILRRNDNKSTKNKKIMNLANLNLKIFNADYLKEKQKYLFLTEGIFDALSYENEGYKSISLNSVVMVNQLLKLIKENLDNLINTIFFIALDKDLAGNEWTIKLYDGLIKMNLQTYKLSIKNKTVNDINEYYCKDKNSFISSLNWLKENIINKNLSI